MTRQPSTSLGFFIFTNPRKHKARSVAGIRVLLGLHAKQAELTIAAKIESSSLPEEEKRPLLQAVRELPGEAIKHLSENLLDLGLDNLPGAAALIHTVLQTVRGF